MTLTVKDFFLISNLNLHSLHLKPFPLCYYNKPCYVPFYPVVLLYILKGHYLVTLEPSLPQAEQFQLFQSVLRGEVFHSMDRFCGPPLYALQQVHVSLY